MHKTLTIMAVLAAAACAKDNKSSTTTEHQYAMETQPHHEASEPDVTPTEAEPTAAEEGALPGRDERALAAGGGAPAKAMRAVAVLHPTAGNKVKGIVRFTERDGGVDVTAEVAGLAKGEHAYHVHVYGDCSSPDAESAGAHFAFEDHPGAAHITGNLGELEPARDGMATETVRIEHATLHGKRSILGRSVVVHEKGNDESKPPDGAAGKRLACGVIGIH